MFSSTFIFAPGEYDAEFHALDASIAEAARAIPGYLGEESWEDPARGRICNVYYWASMEALQALMQHPAHLRAKQAQARWLKGYQVLVAQVLASYGDGGLPDHPLAGHAIRPKAVAA